MLADEIYGALRNYINQTLVGMGALKGASAQLSNSYDSESGINTMTWQWEDNEGTEHTTTVLVHDGAKGETGASGPAGAPGSPGADGVSPTITVKTSTGDTYILTITTKDGEFDTPNLKGGGASSMADLSDVDLTALSAGKILVYITTPDGQGGQSGKWAATNEIITNAQWAAIEALYA